MKENVLDVLMYLFEHYIDEDQIAGPDRADLELRLVEAGFGDTEVSKAFDWLESLATLETKPLSGKIQRQSQRIYSDEESSRLGAEGIGFLLFLEQNGVLASEAREQVLEHALALDLDHVDLDQLKWVVLMVLFNQKDQAANLAWLEDLVYDEGPVQLH